MHTIIYTTEPILKGRRSIFLAGPSPRQIGEPTWRPEAHQILENLGYKGIVFDPEWRGGTENAPTQLTGYPADWEWEALEASTIIVFWVPRNNGSMIGLTTNVEFGMRVRCDHNVLYGRPDGAWKTRYLDWAWKKFQPTTPFNDLQTMLTRAHQAALHHPLISSTAT